MAIADISTKMVFGCFQPQEPSRVSNLYEYVCCASWLSLCITKRSPAGPSAWKVMSLPLALVRPTDSSRNWLSCWDLVPTEASPERLSLAQLWSQVCSQEGTSLLKPEHRPRWNWDVITWKFRPHNWESAWDVCPTESPAPLQQAVKQSVLPRGPQSSSTHPFQIPLDKSIRCK